MSETRVDETSRLGARHWSEVTWLLAVRTFRLRYLRSRLGIGWAFVQPLVQAAVLAVVFTKVFEVARLEHYPLYVLSGVMTWSAFSGAVGAATTSAVDNSGLLRKVDMPTVVFPLAQVTAVVLVLCLQVIVLVIGAVVVGTAGPGLLLLPLCVALTAALATGVGLLACSFHVAFRDVKFFVESGLLLAFYASPVLYDPGVLPDGVRTVLSWNPAYGLLSLVRTALLGRPLDGRALLISCVGAVLLLGLGWLVFRRRSADFADLV